MGKTCVAGCDAIDVDETTNRFMVGGKVVREGDFISLNGSTGEVILGKAPLIAPAMTGAFGVFMSWADAVRRSCLALGVPPRRIHVESFGW